MAPIEFIGRYLGDGWFDYAICDEVHQFAGDTAQGNALGTLASCAGRIVELTGTLLGGYADDVYNTLFRLEPRKMVEKNGIRETADNVWRALTREHQKLFATSSNVPQSPSELVSARFTHFGLRTGSVD
jgi:hypothetical protein